jgi:hypothetical protein
LSFLMNVSYVLQQHIASEWAIFFLHDNSDVSARLGWRFLFFSSLRVFAITITKVAGTGMFNLFNHLVSIMSCISIEIDMHIIIHQPVYQL